ncbi:hypothetical protein LWI28_004121 [Acer negundo]|uniref:Uncharacterized protein n=1 Tax=Acer negundo TaxID=4023 RepID=A0AAD5JCN4_ACENE|nr:hypothetical protein LWI28_004121 [Acer negundo]
MSTSQRLKPQLTGSPPSPVHCHRLTSHQSPLQHSLLTLPTHIDRFDSARLSWAEGGGFRVEQNYNGAQLKVVVLSAMVWSLLAGVFTVTGVGSPCFMRLELLRIFFELNRQANVHGSDDWNSERGDFCCCSYSCCHQSDGRRSKDH